MLVFNVINWLEKRQLPCPVKSILHIDCPGCGFQRSFAELLKGNLPASFHFHPATIPLLLFFLFSFIHLVRPIKNGNKLIVGGYIFVAAIVLTNYIYKIIYADLT